jgi:uncharacterized protein (DUF1501 family)
MLTRRSLLERALRGSSLVAAGPLVPGFLATTARAAEPGGETVLVVLELTGGNDGLNTVIPYADDLYHKARPTLHLTRQQVVRVDDRIGLNPGLRGLEKLLSAGQVAVVQGVGYPNPDRSHFESMDVWQSADPKRAAGTGWLGRSLGAVRVRPGRVPGMHVGTGPLPLALRGSATGVPTVHPGKPFDLELTPQSGPPVPYQPFGFGAPPPFEPNLSATGPRADRHLAPRRRMIEDLAELAPSTDPMLQFVRRTSLQTYASVEQLRDLARANRRNGPGFQPFGTLGQELSLVAGLIAAELGTRIFYLSVSGFDTHANQAQSHQQLLQQVADAVAGFFGQLEQSKHAGRVLLMTFSEFGRRVQENGSRGTDHGAASCLFVVGPGVRGGVVGEHPSLQPDRLDAGDLRHHTDFRRVYATLLDGWLGVDSREALGASYDPLPFLKRAEPDLRPGAPIKPA